MKLTPEILKKIRRGPISFATRPLCVRALIAHVDAIDSELANITSDRDALKLRVRRCEALTIKTTRENAELKTELGFVLSALKRALRLGAALNGAKQFGERSK